MKPLRSIAITITSAVVLLGACSQALAADACERLASLKLPHTTITAAQSVPAGKFEKPPGAQGPPRGPPPDFSVLPALCRVTATARPTPESDIRIEIWMPVAGWTGRLDGVGTGGFAGAVNYIDMIPALLAGNATAGTDTGHVIGADMANPTWALGHPARVTDFGYRGVHEMTQIAKSIIKAFYGSGPGHSYFLGCSNAGRQALMEAQRFPQDYDGILAGAPANYWTRAGIWTSELAATMKHGGYIPSAKLATVERTVNAACDARDGVADGILNDPRDCHFDPAALLCKAGDSDQCLTAAQVGVLRSLYAGPHDAQGHLIYPGFLPGAESGRDGWALWIMGPAPAQGMEFAFAHGYFSNIIFSKPDWDFKDIDLDGALHAAETKTARILNATDPDLSAFASRGGKLILYHGWNDPALPALNTVNYYESVVRHMGARATTDFTRLYMVPGMHHCTGGPGPDSFGQNGPAEHTDPQHDIELALEQWVEKAVAPSSIIATKYVDNDIGKGVRITRPLCPYPQAAQWTGRGSTDDAANFVCKTP
jgi:Tannase and feruloyl esterase